jgi:2-polyprenyl-3-methyl-5-hydroxy-6-metoxy-1,4-benzoquinol methylase
VQQHPTLEIDRLSFYWRMAKRANDDVAGIPATLPFKFDYSDALGLIMQTRDPIVLDALRRAYLLAENVGYLQDGHALAASYGGDFLGFIDRQARAAGAVLEIGCGGTYVLQQLRKLGFSVCGVDPSPVAVESGRKHGIDVVRSFYPGELGLDRKFDVIIHYDVLEHIADPVQFLRAHHEQLGPGGMIVFAVPDCTEHIERGDISMIIHEHLNFFDAESLRRTVERAGFNVITVEPGKHGGLLFCAATRAAGEVKSTQPIAGKYDRFIAKASKARDEFRRLVDAAPAELGLYVPLRAIPYLAAVGLEKRFRFFDDDPGCHGRYFAAYDVPVENFTDFMEKPPSTVLVASFPFGGRIKEKIAARCGDAVRVVTLREMLE